MVRAALPTVFTLDPRARAQKQVDPAAAGPGWGEGHHPGGTYNFAIGAEPISIEPLNTQESEGAEVEHQIFQGLYILQLQPDGTTKAVPHLAEKTEVNSDATVFTFTIRQGVMFLGCPWASREVTAQDSSSTPWAQRPGREQVRHHVHHRTDQGHGPEHRLRRRSHPGAGVKALDKYTLQVTLQYPFADFPATLVHPITHVFPVDYANKIGRKAFFDKPVGSGPYMVQEWKHNQSVTLVQDASYGTRTAARRTRPVLGTSTPSTCRSTPTSTPSGSPSRRAPSTTPPSRRATSRPPRTTRAPRTAPGPSRPTRARPCTSSASR